MKPGQTRTKILVNAPSGTKPSRRPLGVSVYFARVYHFWERDLNENTNGLIRQYFPKKMPQRDLSVEWVKQVRDLLNHRPRKTLGYLTPHEILVEGKQIRV